MFAEPRTLDKFATSGTVDLARFQNNLVNCTSNPVGKISYECKPLPLSSISGIAGHPVEDIEL